MPSQYAVEGSVAVAGDSPLTVIGSATVMPGIFYVMLGSESSPVDATIIAVVKRFTADGTGSVVTPEPLQADDRAANVTAKQTYTVEPTYAGVPYLNICLNQKLIYQWFAREGGELIGAKAAGDGIGLQLTTFSTGTPTMSAVFHFKE